MWSSKSRSKCSLQESVLAFHHIGHRDQSHVLTSFVAGTFTHLTILLKSEFLALEKISLRFTARNKETDLLIDNHNVFQSDEDTSGGRQVDR